MTSLQIVNRYASNSATRFIQSVCQQAEDMNERVTSSKWQSGLFPSNILKPSLWFGLDEILRRVPLLPGNSPFQDLFFKKFLLGGAFVETRKCKRHNAGMNTCIKMRSGNGIKAGGGFEKKNSYWHPSHRFTYWFSTFMWFYKQHNNMELLKSTIITIKGAVNFT